MLQQFNRTRTDPANNASVTASDPEVSSRVRPGQTYLAEPRMIPVKKVVRLVVSCSLVGVVIAALTLGSFAYANTSNKFHSTRGQLHATQKTLVGTQTTLAATQAKRDEYLRKLNETQVKLAGANSKLAALQGKLSTTENKLSTANQTLSIQGTQISTLKKCLSGISTSYAFFLDGNFDMALGALQATGPACDTAYKYF
jgi:septal ring factor EnvC (AmiA/AmiB activator)